jgi:peptide/nickel transport system substrate-binding protein
MGVLADGYRSTKVIDDHTVEVDLTKSVPTFLDALANFTADIVPAKTYKAEGGASFAKHPVGAGPFMVKEFVTGSHLKFSKNPYYWDSGRPYLDTITWNFATDSNSRLLSLVSGEAQIADGITFSQVDSVQSNKKLLLQSIPVPAWIGLHLNEKVPAFADQRVRQAIQYAIDRRSIIDTVFHGAATNPNSIMPAFPEYDAKASVVRPYSYDLAKAKQLMAQSSHPHGFKVKLTYPSGLDYYNQLTVLLKHELAQINIDVDLVPQDAATVANKLYNMDYDMTFPFPELTSDVAVPDEFALLYGTDGGFYTGWNDSGIKDLVDKFTSTVDQASRKQQWPIIQGKLLEASPEINVVNVPFLNAHATNVCGTDVNVLGVDYLKNTWIASP